MYLHGSLYDNLSAAIASATRLRGHPVHRDTLEFWSDLLAHARAVIRRARVLDVEELKRLVAELEACLVAHQCECR